MFSGLIEKAFYGFPRFSSDHFDYLKFVAITYEYRANGHIRIIYYNAIIYKYFLYIHRGVQMLSKGVV